MGISAALASHVSSPVRDRGCTYLRAGAVRLDSVRASEVAATVSGTDEYEVDLVVEGRVVHAWCTCPYLAEYGAVCKHIWATVLAAEARGFGAALTPPLRLVLEGEDDDPDDSTLEFEPGRRERRPRAVPREAWLDQLDALRRQLEPSAGAQPERLIVYVLDATGGAVTPRLTVETAVSERKKNGDWGKPQARVVSQTQVPHLPDPVDRRLLTLLNASEPVYSSSGWYNHYSASNRSRVQVEGPLLDVVIPLLAESGRVRLRPQQDAELRPLTHDAGPPWELAVEVARDPAGKEWRLVGSLRRGDEARTLAAPDLLTPGLVVLGDTFAAFRDGGAFAWVQTLARGPVRVPEKQGADLAAQLLQMPRLPRVILPDELRLTEEAVTPRPRLVVRPTDRTYGPPMLRGELTFLYADRSVPANTPGRGVLLKDERRFLLRDPAAEAAAQSELARLGFRPTWNGKEQVPEVKPAALPKIARELAAAGWLVEADGKVYRTPGLFKLAVRTGTDWFDLSASADFGGELVALPKLLEALRRGDGTVVLGDGSLGLLPEDWLKKNGLLAALGTVEGDSVRYAKAQVGVLDALLASRPEVEFDAAFARARAELKKFTGVAPADPPKGFVGELRDYQKEGLGWLRFLRRFGFGGCLADDMGLGKTVQVLALLAGTRGGPALVVVPKSLVFNWKAEAARFAPRLKVLDHTGTARDRTGSDFHKYDLVLTTYGTLRNDAETFSTFRFDTCVLDESQAAKNAETETAKAVRLIRADHRLALSGTPVENHLGELWTLFDFLNPGMLGKAALFGVGAGGRSIDPEARELLARALRPYILRRTKDQVAKDLPAKTEQTVYCDLGPEQRKLYDELRDHYRQVLLDRVDAVGIGKAKLQVLSALLRLRQAACHPGLVDPKRVGEPSAKLDELVPHLEELVESGQKVLVFSQFTSLLAIVKKRLDAAGLVYESLDGRTRDRAARVEHFQSDPECRLFLISLKAGGVGLNLTAAGYVFLLDPWWNPAAEAQAVDRTHRIGQTKPVFAYRLIARDTVEEKVLALQASKRELADAILGGDAGPITELKREDLELLLS
ncbi:ATP-dependent helicase HepA [Urbifossiella limnaea]|uniref:ATP-dependent helicase HepA n=2 Tax=Urbifossiella limnaea TaxID=2528023 RepID=A0A517XYI5_9BACT|nr:ATP-dependent helicase HepA [Urbifossiella limnaea]